MKTHFFKPIAPVARPHDGIVRREFYVGKHKVTWTQALDFIIPGTVGEQRIEWEPVPNKLSPTELAIYAYERNKIMQEIANMIGKPVVVADI